jgi:hypothetical protein
VQDENEADYLGHERVSFTLSLCSLGINLYIAPELHEDVFFFAITLSEILLGSPLFFKDLHPRQSAILIALDPENQRFRTTFAASHRSSSATRSSETANLFGNS